MKRFTATANDEGVRLSRFVLSVTAGLPASLLYKSFRNKRIKVNGKRAAPDARLAAGDVIELYINDEFFPPEKPARPAKPARPRQPRVQVVYEDANIAVLYKPAHLLCHGDRTGDANLVDAFTAYLTGKGEYAPGGENRFAPALCNRLDRGTEGLVIAAKNYAALRDMNEIIRTDRLKKEYYTITVGIPTTRRPTRSASTPTPTRPAAASRSSPTWTCCAPPAPTPCAGSASSPGAPTRSAPTWPTWGGRCWGISNTATARPTSGPAQRPRPCARCGSASWTSRRTAPCTIWPAR